MMNTDSAEKGLMAGAGNIGEESYDAFRKAYEHIDLTPVPRAWTPEELAGKVLVSCKIARTGLDPFIDLCQPFDSFVDAQFFYEAPGPGPGNDPLRNRRCAETHKKPAYQGSFCRA